MSTSEETSAMKIEIDKLEEDGSNYLEWKFQMEQVLDLYDLLSLTTEEPKSIPVGTLADSTTSPPTAAVKPTTAEMTTYNDWKKKDKRARLRINTSILRALLKTTMSKT